MCKNKSKKRFGNIISKSISLANYIETFNSTYSQYRTTQFTRKPEHL